MHNVSLARVFDCELIVKNSWLFDCKPTNLKATILSVSLFIANQHQLSVDIELTLRICHGATVFG